ncbi:MAG TPA: hypothetical protein VFF94_04690, partial [Novosphingobium sp.]|nr:hypothetical protein [Novosphingobium sp.]
YRLSVTGRTPAAAMRAYKPPYARLPDPAGVARWLHTDQANLARNELHHHTPDDRTCRCE